MYKKVLYHGSKHIIDKPQYGIGNPKNDYGLAFYCTEFIELAKEWAVDEENGGYANCYEIDMSNLDILNLGNGNYNILNWLAILLENRTFRMNIDSLNMRDYILTEFLPEYNGMDIIKGYRADDSYFSFANAFLNNSISLEKLAKVMKLGELGEQYAIKSSKAFERIVYKGAFAAKQEEYFPRKKYRDSKARDFFAAEKDTVAEGVYMIDVFRQQWRDGDERIQRIIY